MVRRHGWQLPAHTLQVVAITVFFLLVIAFYAFLAPFLGTQIIEYASIAVYTAAAFAVFILYIRCTRINPADPGIMARFDSAIINRPENNPGLRVNLPDNCDNDGIGMHSNSSSVSRSSLDGNSNKKVWTGEDGKVGVPIGAHKKSSSPCCILGGFIFALFVKEDCRNEQDMEQYIQSSEDDALFCTLCNAEVLKYSKHCRSCDKCVDGFDHHCRWLNNCVGRKNYKTFISLMTMSLIWLVIEFGVGIAVLVLCFVNKQDTENNIVKKLGNGFSRAPFATVVAICTAVSLLACVPLGELLFFHIILIKKGITTYEYVVAMRAMSEAPPASANEEGENVLYSRTNSATTGFSGGSSLGLPYKGVWCTPPRVFVDQDEVIPHLDPGRAPSTVDPDASGYAERGNKAKRAVKISTWKLAKLDSKEAMRAAAKARASSSVLRPVDARRIPGADVSSTSNASIKLSPVPDSYPPSLGSKEDYEAGTHTASSFSSPGHTHEPVSLARLPDWSLGPRGPPPGVPLRNPTLQVASAGVTENTRASVVWDQEAGRYVSVLASSRPHTNMEVPVRAPVVSSSSRPSNASVVTPIHQPERLMYTGQSIFFGGPLLNAPPRDGRRNEGSIGVTADAERETDVPHGVRGGRGRTADSFPVFAPGALQRNAPSNS